MSSKIDSWTVKYIQDCAPDSLLIFTQEFWRIIEPKHPFSCNWHVELICDKLQEYATRVGNREPKTTNLAINVPPGSTKSTLISVMLPSWAWINWPWMKFISGSHDDRLSLRDAVKSRDIIKSSLYQYCFADRFKLKIDVNKKSEYANDKGGIRLATSVTGSITGWHADIYTNDDLVNPKGAKSEAEIEVVNDYMDLIVPSRMTDLNKSVQIMIMQRIAETDPTGHVLKKDPTGWEHISLPAELVTTKEGKEIEVKPPEAREKYIDGLLDPNRLPRVELEKMEKTLGKKGYAGQYLQAPAPMEGNIFKKDWFKRFNLLELEREAAQKLTPIVWHFRGDTAYTKKEANDPTGFWVYCYLGQNWYIKDFTTVRLEMPALIEFCKTYATKNDYSDQSSFKIEPKASGLSLIQMLKESTQLNISKTKDPEGDKVYRANLVAPTVESGRVFLLEGAPWVDDFIHDVTFFPDAQHDEAVDLLTMTLLEKVIVNTGGTIFTMKTIG